MSPLKNNQSFHPQPTHTMIKTDSIQKQQDEAHELKTTAGRLYYAGRATMNHARDVERLADILCQRYGSDEAKAEAAASLPELVQHLIAEIESQTNKLPALRAVANRAAPADIDARERSLDRLGMTVRVRYVGPTNTKGGRYVAEVCGDDDAARVYVGSQTHNRDESSRLEAAERCLAKWHAARVAWWAANSPTGTPWSSPLPVIVAKGSTGDAWLFFAK